MTTLENILCAIAEEGQAWELGGGPRPGWGGANLAGEGAHLPLRLRGSRHRRCRLLLQHQLSRPQLLLLHLPRNCTPCPLSAWGSPSKDMVSNGAKLMMLLQGFPLCSNIPHIRPVGQPQ